MLEIKVYYPVVKRRIDEESWDSVKFKLVLPKKLLLFWVEKKTGEHLAIPAGYGVAYYDFETAKVLYAPIPFNILVGFLIWAWSWVRTGCTYWLYKHTPKKKL